MTFFTSLTINLVLPVFFFYLPLLAYTLEASTFEIGTVGAAPNAVYWIVALVVGRFFNSSRNRKSSILFATMLLAAVSFLYSMVSSPLLLIALRVFEGLGTAIIWPALEASVVQESRNDPSKSLTLFNAISTGGTAFGPLFGSMLIIFTSLRTSFAIAAGSLLVVFSVNAIHSLARLHTEARETPISKMEVTLIETGREFLSKGDCPPKRLGFFLTSAILVSACSGVVFTFVTPLAQARSVSIQVIGLITFTYGVSRFLTYSVVHRESFRRRILESRGRVKRTLIAFSVLALSILLFLIPNQTWMVYLTSLALAGTGYSLVFTMAQNSIIGEADRQFVGSETGKFEFAIGFGAFFGPFIAGILSGGSLVTPFLLPVVALVFMVIGAAAEKRKPRPVSS